MSRGRVTNLIVKGLFLIIILFLACGVWYSPIIFKGYPSQTISSRTTLVRNYYKTGVLADENDLKVTLASSLIEEQGHPLSISEYFEEFLHAQVFKIFGAPSYNGVILLSVVLLALSLVLFTISVLYLFNLKTAVVFSLIYIFIPFSWAVSTQRIGSYEFGFLFLSLFLIFYFWGIGRNRQLLRSDSFDTAQDRSGQALRRGSGQARKFSVFLFIVSGIFFALAGFAKPAFFVLASAFFIFLALNKFKKQLIYIFVPFVILLAVVWMPSIIRGENAYFSLVTKKASQESAFSGAFHLFPDSYTYHFGKDEFFERLKNQDLGMIEGVETKKILANLGFRKFGISDRFKVSSYILSKHFFRFISLEEFGGPLITLLAILGFFYLRKKYRYIYRLSVYLLAISYFIFCYIVTVSRTHLMDFVWILVLAVTLGLFYLIDILKQYFGIGGKKAIFFEIIVIGLVFYHLLLVNHVVLAREYDRDDVPRSLAYAQEIKNLSLYGGGSPAGREIKDSEVIAIPGDFSNQAATLNYLTDKSFIIFKSSTLKKLLSDPSTSAPFDPAQGLRQGSGKAKEAFEFFGVKYILGYSEDLSNKIVEQTGVNNIASNSLEVDMGEISGDKSFLLNLIR